MYAHNGACTVTALLVSERNQSAYIRILELLEVSIPGADREKHRRNPQDRELIGFSQPASSAEARVRARLVVFDVV